MEGLRAARTRSRSRHMAQASTVLPSHFLAKLLLFQAKVHTTPFHPLSFNILREVCSYLGFTPSVAFIIDHQVCILDMEGMRWKHLDVSSRKVSNGYNVVMVGFSQVFVCGGAEKSKLLTDHKYCALADVHGEVEVMSMVQGRYEHALVYDEVTMSVYMFGGYAAQGVALKSSQAFSLIRGVWRELPKMRLIEGFAISAKYKESIYLMGYVGRIEVFSLPFCTFSIPNINLPFLPGAFSCLIYKDSLCLFSHEYLVKWNLRENCIEQLALSKEVNSECPVVLKEQWCYVLKRGKLEASPADWCIDLESGEVVEAS